MKDVCGFRASGADPQNKGREAKECLLPEPYHLQKDESIQRSRSQTRSPWTSPRSKYEFTLGHRLPGYAYF